MNATKVIRESGWNEIFSVVLIENNGRGRDYYEIARWDTYPIDGEKEIVEQFPATSAGLEDAKDRAYDLAWASRIHGMDAASRARV